MRKRDAIVLIVICGFAVLSAGAVSMGGRMHARTLMCAANMRFIGAAISEYADMYGGRLPQLEYNPGTPYETQQHPAWAFRDGTSGGSIGKAINLGCLYKAGLIHNPGTFYCPADRRWIDSMISYATGGPWGEKVPALPVNDSLILGTPGDPVPAVMPLSDVPYVIIAAGETAARLSRAITQSARLRHRVIWTSPLSLLQPLMSDATSAVGSFEKASGRFLLITNQPCHDADIVMLRSLTSRSAWRQCRRFASSCSACSQFCTL